MAILAIGFFIVLLSGGIDVSFPAVAIVAQYITVNILIASGVDNLWFAFAMAAAIGIAFGAVNAFFISMFKIPTFIVTLATMNIFHGAMLEFVGTKAINAGQLPHAFKTFGLTYLFSLPRGDGTYYGLTVFIADPGGSHPHHVAHPAIHRPGPGDLRHGREHGGGQARRVQPHPRQFLHLLLRGPAGLHHGDHPRVPYRLQQRHLHHQLGAPPRHCRGSPWRVPASWEAQALSRAPSSG